MTGPADDRTPDLRRARQWFKKWTRRIVVLTAVGLLVQVGFVIWRMQTPLTVPPNAWAVVRVTTPGATREVLIHERFGATDCFSESFQIREDRIGQFASWGSFMGVFTIPGAPEQPAWFLPWTDEEIRSFEPLLPAQNPDPRRNPFLSFIRLGVGFPYRSFHGTRVFLGIVDARGHSGLISPSGAIASPGFLKLGSLELPVRPIWPGLLLNIAIVAVPMLVLLGVCDVWRWFHRARAGECTGCRYDLSGVPGRSRCPECGLERVA